MLQEFTAQYFFTSRGFGPDAIRDVTLIDSDLTRGNDDIEIATEPGSDFEIFNGYEVIRPSPAPGEPNFFEFIEGEVTTTVSFADGTTITGVLGLYDAEFSSFGGFVGRFLLDAEALADAGKTIADVVDVEIDALVDHDLTWEELGFTATGNTVPAPDPDPDPDPEPEPDPVLNLIAGTAGRDTLVGTGADDAVLGGAGSDRVSGGIGADSFIFGAEAENGVRERDVIRDFDVDEDSIVFEAGAVLRFVEDRNGSLIIRLEGDGDTIVVRGGDLGAVSTFVFTDDLFLA